VEQTNIKGEDKVEDVYHTLPKLPRVYRSQIISRYQDTYTKNFKLRCIYRS